MFAETLAGIALVKSAVDGIKSAIGTAKDISGNSRRHRQAVHRRTTDSEEEAKEVNDPFSVGSVARETIDAKDREAEHM